ncbi:MAG: C39 family peptidase [Planctomycetaceae bacterium]|nr:C39 family peptidase [Planctomycetaceae bacterium]
MESQLQFEIGRQPDLFTCGPTCLQAVYRFFNYETQLQNVIDETPRLENGGTLAVSLACHALERGFRAMIHTWNLLVFDPTWFPSDPADLRAALIEQQQLKQDPRIQQASEVYLRFLELGGELRMDDLNSSLIRKYLKKNIPILTGLSATYLYREPREYGLDSHPDPIRGTPQGHFVVLCGYDSTQRKVLVADPLHPNPLANQNQKYLVGLDSVICSIMLGIVTYDANLLILIPPDREITF